MSDGRRRALERPGTVGHSRNMVGGPPALCVLGPGQWRPSSDIVGHTPTATASHQTSLGQVQALTSSCPGAGRAVRVARGGAAVSRCLRRPNGSHVKR